MKPDRAIGKDYPLPEFIEKLRRLADALEKGQRFQIEIAGERILNRIRPDPSPRKRVSAHVVWHDAAVRRRPAEFSLAVDRACRRTPSCREMVRRLSPVIKGHDLWRLA